MIDLRTSPGFGPSGDELEGMLRSFFRAEVPDPWPMMKAPAEPVVVKLPKPRRSTWLRIGPRLAIAASVAFLLLGYLALGSIFPKHQQEVIIRGERNIANRPVLRQIITPKGFPNIMEEKVNSDRTINIKFWPNDR